MTSPGRALAGLLLAAAVAVSPARPAEDGGAVPEPACGLRDDIQRMVLEDARKLAVV